MQNIIIPEYLWLYFLRSEWDRETNFYSWGSSTIVFSWETFQNLTIMIPPYYEQAKLVRQYQVISNRIAIKQRINDNLDEIAKILYKQVIEYKSEEDLESIYSILSVINGGAFSSEFFNTEQIGYPLIRIRDLSSCKPDIYTSENLKSMEYIHCGDILIGMDGEFIPHIWFGDIGVLNQRVCKVVPVEKFIHPLFLYWTLKPILAEIQRTQGGTTVIHIGKKDFDRMQVFRLSKDKHLYFKHRVEPIFTQMLCNYKEIIKMAEMQALLLSRLSH